MVTSAGSPRIVIVKRRGSKRHVAERDDWDSPKREAGDPARTAGDPVRTADDPCADPARRELAPATAQ